MKFIPTAVQGSYIIELNRRLDERGFFCRLFCKETFQKEGLPFDFVQMNHSFSEKRGTLRGMHYQTTPHEEVKLLQTLRGSLYDVVMDIRPYSPTFGKYSAVTLSEENGAAVLIPKGCAHGFITLDDNTEALYLVSSPYTPSLEAGIRFDDPFFNVRWPFPPTILSEKDKNLPYFYPISVHQGA